MGALSGYTFRIKLPKAKGASLQIDTAKLTWDIGAGLPALRLSSGSDKPISQTDVLYFTSDGWPDEANARAASERYVGALARTLACLRVGVDYGDRVPGGGGFTDWFIQKCWDEHGVRLINEQPGIIVYETEPTPAFGRGFVAITHPVPASRFEAVFAAALKDPQPLSTRERVSMALYNAAFFEQSQDTRFLLNMMALEALVERAARSAEAQAHVDYMIKLTRSAEHLAQKDRESLCRGLDGLKKQSIGQAGREYVRQLLGRKYGGMDPDDFFTRCYSLRSKLVHGHSELPSCNEVSSAAAGLEGMVSDLLAGSLRDVTHGTLSGN